MGTVSFLSVLTAAIFKLNQPVTHLFTRLMMPLHLAFIIPFIRLGQRLHGAELLEASVPELVNRFKNDPMGFLGDFGLAAWHGFAAWLLVAPFLLLGVKLLLTPVFRACANKWSRNKEVTS
jgi:thiosulfate reductase cytochrome b subunit